MIPKKIIDEIKKIEDKKTLEEISKIMKIKKSQAAYLCKKYNIKYKKIIGRKWGACDKNKRKTRSDKNKKRKLKIKKTGKGENYEETNKNISYVNEINNNLPKNINYIDEINNHLPKNNNNDIDKILNRSRELVNSISIKND